MGVIRFFRLLIISIHFIIIHVRFLKCKGFSLFLPALFISECFSPIILKMKQLILNQIIPWSTQEFCLCSMG